MFAGKTINFLMYEAIQMCNFVPAIENKLQPIFLILRVFPPPPPRYSQKIPTPPTEFELEIALILWSNNRIKTGLKRPGFWFSASISRKKLQFFGKILGVDFLKKFRILSILKYFWKANLKIWLLEDLCNFVGRVCVKF